MGAGAAALTHGAGSATSFSAGMTAVFGSASGSYGTQFAAYTFMNSMAHKEQLNTADEKGWGGVVSFAGYSASAVLSTSLNPFDVTKAEGLRQWAGVVLTDNVSDNMKNGELGFHSLHVTIVGYNFDNNSGYSILSKGINGNRRFDMAFESILGLSLIKTDINFNYRLPYKDNCGKWHMKHLMKNFHMNTAFIGYYSRKALELSDGFFEVWKQKTTYQHWYDLHYNEDGTPKY